jgi:DNA-binding GntR family transcriptional regulator
MMPEPFAVPRADRRPITRQQFAYDQLRAGIIGGALGPGERLVIDDLARQLDTSIIPVREALRLLEAEGFVMSVAHVGATVAPLSRESVAEVFTILEGLEAVSSRAAAERAQPADLAELGELVAAMDGALAANRPADWAELNARFHLTIGRIASMPMLLQMLQRALDHWDRVRRHYFSGVLVRRTDQAQREHHEMLSLMQARDTGPLEALVRRHNRAALASYAEYLDARADAGNLR